MILIEADPSLDWCQSQLLGFKKLEERYRGKKMAKEGEEIDIGEYVQAELEYEATGVRPAKKKIFRQGN